MKGKKYFVKIKGFIRIKPFGWKSSTIANAKEIVDQFEIQMQSKIMVDTLIRTLIFVSEGKTPHLCIYA